MAGTRALGRCPSRAPGGEAAVVEELESLKSVVIRLWVELRSLG
ncbi:MAG: hypothetical protein Q4G69_13475 [Planctomycetia bacterium]|nr:hypothetical protein [Planctomycetia bacterium]